MSYKNYRNTTEQWRRLLRLVILFTLIGVLAILGLHILRLIIWLQVVAGL